MCWPLHTYLNVYTQTNKLDINDQLSNIEQQFVQLLKWWLSVMKLNLIKGSYVKKT